MANLDGMRRELESKVVRVAGAVADEVERELKGDAPVDSGLLRSLISAQIAAYARGARIDIESAAPYAHFVREHREEWDATIHRLPSMIKQAWRNTR